jgi:hypothetical protein
MELAGEKTSLVLSQLHQTNMTLCLEVLIKDLEHAVCTNLTHRCLDYVYFMWYVSHHLYDYILIDKDLRLARAFESYDQGAYNFQVLQ